MQFKELIADDRAVSPVIGVILMVAITVILAAVIGTFVLGLGSSVQQTTPQAQFGFEVTSSSADCLSGAGKNVQITHESGEAIDAGDMTLQTSVGSNTWDSCAGIGATSDVSAGSEVIVSSNADTTIRVVWNSPEGDNSATLGKFDVPS